MLCFVHKEKTPCKLLSYKELHKAYRTRSGYSTLILRENKRITSEYK